MDTFIVVVVVGFAFAIGAAVIAFILAPRTIANDVHEHLPSDWDRL